MYPLDNVMKIMKEIKKFYKDKMYFSVWYNSVSITLIEDGKASEKSFSFNEVLGWFNNPIFYFKRSWIERNDYNC